MLNKGINQVDLSKKSGMTQATISRVLSEQRNPGINFCEAISRVLNYPLDEVLSIAGLIPNNRTTYLLIQD